MIGSINSFLDIAIYTYDKNIYSHSYSLILMSLSYSLVFLINHPVQVYAFITYKCMQGDQNFILYTDSVLWKNELIYNSI